MKDVNDILFLVQARLSSQRIPEKMLKPFAGTTLMDICIKKILNSDIIPKENFYISAYEDEIKQVCKKYGVNIFHRSEKSALSEGTPMTDIYEWWDKLPYKYCILINACAPFFKLSTIEDFAQQYMKSSSAGMFGVMDKKNYFWDENFNLITPWPEGYSVMNTKYVSKTYEAAHCLYASRLDSIGNGLWMGDFLKPGDIELFPVAEEECLDIDYPWQFEMCETLYKSGRR